MENRLHIEVCFESVPTVSNAHPMVTRGKSGITKPNQRYVLFNNRVAYPEPKTVTAALKDEYWNAAMTEEYDNCIETNTWTLVPYTSDMKVIGNGWIYKSMVDENGVLKKRRARMVARGNHQEEGIDYLETYSPVVRTPTVWLVLHLATIMKWEIKQMNVSNAFLHGDLKETVYMLQPAGFIDKARPTHVCKLNKSLYGLKQSPRAWFDKFSNFLLEFGFVCSTADPSLFIYMKGSDVIMLLLYVDDMAITGNKSTVMYKLLQELHKQFRMKDLGRLHYFLGIQVHFHDGGLFLTQQKYADDLLVLAGMDSCSPMPTPLPVQLNRENEPSPPFSNPTYFRSLAGKL